MSDQKSSRGEERVSRQVIALGDRLVQTLKELVQIPSENTPPVGAELGCQQYVHERLVSLGLKAELYEISNVPGLADHPAFRHQRNYIDRPNVAAVWSGTGGGRSLLLSGHIDTVPRGSAKWNYDPFGATIEGNRLY